MRLDRSGRGQTGATHTATRVVHCGTQGVPLTPPSELPDPASSITEQAPGWEMWSGKYWVALGAVLRIWLFL